VFRCLKGMLRALPSLAAVLTFLVSSGLGDNLPNFEAASAKHSDPNSRSGPNECTGGPDTPDPGMLHCTNSSLALFILQAYDLKWYKLISPDWVIHGGSQSGYDINAKIPPGTSKADYRLMLQHLLADRFHLVVHRETRELPVYRLIPGAGKPKLIPSPSPAPPGPRCAMSMVKNHFHWACHNTLLKDLAGNLETLFWSDVIDETGLNGEYDFTFDFIPPEEWQGRVGWSPSSAIADDTPTLDTAVSEQLSLKLKRGKGPVQVLVVDRAEKNPTEN
jgi:uncharacterized protein (TIGR03435 family)